MVTIPPTKMVMTGDGLWHCFTYIIALFYLHYSYWKWSCIVYLPIEKNVIFHIGILWFHFYPDRKSLSKPRESREPRFRCWTTSEMSWVTRRWFWLVWLMHAILYVIVSLIVLSFPFLMLVQAQGMRLYLYIYTVEFVYDCWIWLFIMRCLSQGLLSLSLQLKSTGTHLDSRPR